MSPSSNTFLLLTGGFNRCWFSPIHFWKLNAWSRPFAIAVVLSRSRSRAGELEPADLEGASRRFLFGIGERQHRAAHGAAGLPQQLLPEFRMGVKLLGRARALERLANGVEAVAHRPGARMLAVERQVGVVAHAAVGPRLVEIGRRGAEVE